MTVNENEGVKMLHFLRIKKVWKFKNRDDKKYYELDIETLGKYRVSVKNNVLLICSVRQWFVWFSIVSPETNQIYVLKSAVQSLENYAFFICILSVWLSQLFFYFIYFHYFIFFSYAKIDQTSWFKISGEFFFSHSKSLSVPLGLYLKKIFHEEKFTFFFNVSNIYRY